MIAKTNDIALRVVFDTVSPGCLVIEVKGFPWAKRAPAKGGDGTMVDEQDRMIYNPKSIFLLWES